MTTPGPGLLLNTGDVFSAETPQVASPQMWQKRGTVATIQRRFVEDGLEGALAGPALNIAPIRYRTDWSTGLSTESNLF